MPKKIPRDVLDMTVEVASADFRRKLAMAAERLHNTQVNGNQKEVRDAVAKLGPFAPLIVLEIANSMSGQDRQDFAMSLWRGLIEFSPLPKSSHWRALNEQASLGLEDRKP